MTTINIGYSELPGRTFGKMQRMEASAGRQVIELMRRFNGHKWPDGQKHRLTPNEGVRSRADQLIVWNDWLKYRQVLAAPPYTSTHDEILHGDAVDFGMEGGAVLSGIYREFVIAEGKKLGILPTGSSFSRPETWHFNSYPNLATEVAPSTLTISVLREDPAVAQPEDDMAQVDKDNAKYAAIMVNELREYGKGNRIKRWLVQADKVYKNRFGKSYSLNEGDRNVALRNYALGGTDSTLDRIVLDSAAYKSATK